MRLIPVEIQHLSDVKPTVEFYMGKNTPQRRQFIIDNLLKESAVG